MRNVAIHSLLVAGLCVAPVFAEYESRIESSDESSRIESSQSLSSGDESLRSERIQSDTSVVGAPVREESKISSSGEGIDRSGAVPFADLGSVETKGDDQALEKSHLIVRGEVSGDDLLLRLPAGTHIHTLSLRSGSGLDLKHSDLMKIWKVEGDDIRLSLSDLRRHGDFDLSNLWVWGTGPESASLLQRVQVGGETKVAGVSDEVRSESEIRSSGSLSPDLRSTEIRTEAPRLEARADTTIGSDLRTDASRFEVERDDDGDVEIERKDGDREIEIERDEDGDVDVDVDDD